MKFQDKEGNLDDDEDDADSNDGNLQKQMFTKE